MSDGGHELDLDLDWQAFCYLTGELAPDEAVDFEALLEDCQAAREALARAVELSAALQATGPASVPASDPVAVPGEAKRLRPALPVWRAAGWMALGAAAALLLAFLVQAQRSGENGRELAQGSAEGRPVSDEAALLWSQLRDEWTAPSSEWPPSEWTPPEWPVATANPSREGLTDLADPAGELPSWMFAALDSFDDRPAENADGAESESVPSDDL